MISRSRLVATLASVLLLASCGDDSGWEMKLTNTAFPYGNQRTAGSGVMYVRAKLLPEKTLTLEKVEHDMTPKAAPAAAPETNPAEKKLEKSLRK